MWFEATYYIETLRITLNNKYLGDFVKFKNDAWIQDDNIAKTVASLPRTEDDSGMVNVGIKRRLKMKNYHKSGLISPNRVYKACEYLVQNHPDYKNIKLASYDDWIKRCPTLFNHTDDSDQGYISKFSHYWAFLLFSLIL